MTTQQLLWTAAGAALLLALVAGVAEHRRGKRRDLDKPGWVPWTFLQVIGLLAAAVAAALALKV